MRGSTFPGLECSGCTSSRASSPSAVGSTRARRAVLPRRRPPARRGVTACAWRRARPSRWALRPPFREQSEFSVGSGHVNVGVGTGVQAALYANADSPLGWLLSRGVRGDEHRVHFLRLNACPHFVAEPPAACAPSGIRSVGVLVAARLSFCSFRHKVVQGTRCPGVPS